MTDSVDIIIDFRGSLSSISLLKVTQVFEQMKPSDVLEIRGADMDTLEDVFRLLPVNTYLAKQYDNSDPDGGSNTIRITKR